MNKNEEMICFEWCFTYNPKILNYSICDSIEECCRNIEKQYRCSINDYIVISKQIRVIENRKTKVIHEEKIIYRKELQGGINDKIKVIKSKVNNVHKSTNSQLALF